MGTGGVSRGTTGPVRCGGTSVDVRSSRSAVGYSGLAVSLPLRLSRPQLLVEVVRQALD